MLLSSGLDVCQTLFASQGIGRRKAHHLSAITETPKLHDHVYYIDGCIPSKAHIMEFTQPYDAGGTVFKIPPSLELTACSHILELFLLMAHLRE